MSAHAPIPSLPCRSRNPLRRSGPESSNGIRLLHCSAASLFLLLAASTHAATNAPAAKPTATSAPRATNAPAARPTGAATTNAPAKQPATAEDKLWTSANTLLKQLKYREAGKQFDEFATKARNDPRYYSALFNRGLCELKLGQDGEAIKTWNLVLQWDMTQTPHRRVALLALDQLAGHYVTQGKADEEAKILARMKTDFPDDPLTAARHAQAAGRKMKTGDYVGAVALYKVAGTNLVAADRKTMDTAEAMVSSAGLTGKQLLELADRSLEEDSVSAAIKLYQTFLEQNESSPLCCEAKTKLGWCLFLRNKYGDAEKLWKDVLAKAPAKDPWLGQSRWHLIQLLAGPRGKKSDAIALCDVQAKEFSGQFRGEQALFVKAWLYWTDKKWSDARVAFSDLIAAYPEKVKHPPIQRYIEDCERGLHAGQGKAS